MKTVIARRVTLLLLAFVMSGCASIPESLLQTPSVKLVDIKVVGMGFKNQTFLLSFDVQNPNAFPLPIKGVSYGLKLDGQRFASGETASNFTVPAEGNSDFAISVDLNLLQTAPQLLTVVRDGAREAIRYELDGEFAVDIPLTPPIQYRNSGDIRLGGLSY